MRNVITVKNLVKQYDRLKAVDDISFTVKKGEIFGLLGENGAGKTTTLEVIEGLRKATSGTVEVLGQNMLSGNHDEIKEKIGIQLQSSAYYNFLTLKEILELFASFYQNQKPALELLELVDLTDKADSLVNKLSGGQKQRFSIVASLVNDPDIVFLDEPTTGLDPLARRNLWDLIAKIKKQGKTIVLTTHYMEEAEVLCDRVAIMDSGKILTIGETHELVRQTKNPYKISFIPQSNIKESIKTLGKIGELENIVGKENHFELRLKTQKDLNYCVRLIQEMEPKSLMVGQASLEDLFIELTGKEAFEND